jgi:putative peptide zinc metalloprotease protein
VCLKALEDRPAGPPLLFIQDLKPMFTRETIVAVHPFSRQHEGEEVVIGNPETGVFLAMPPEALEVLDLLAQGMSVGQVSDLYFQKTGETPDLEDLLNHLQTKGLVEPRTSKTAVRERLPHASRERTYHFSRFPRPLARLLFGRSLLLFEATLIVSAIAAILCYHHLMPVPLDLVFDRRRALSWTILTAFTYGGIFLHEMAHLVAARSLGVNSRLGISHRLWFLVAETDLTGLWSVPRKQRYLPMLAGIIVDATVASILVLILLAERRHLFAISPFAMHLLHAMAFTNLMRILWEFFLFVRTDLYFVAVTFLNCKNLLIDTRVFLRNQLARLTPRVQPVDQSGIPQAERRAIRTYAAIFLAGRAWAFATLFWVTIPVFLGYWKTLTPAFRAGYHANPADFLDASAVAAYFLAPAVAGFAFWAGALFRPKGV